MPILQNASYVYWFSGSAAIPLLWRFLNKWPNPDSARRGDAAAMARLLQPLGLHEKRAHTIIRFSSKLLRILLQYVSVILCCLITKKQLGIGKSVGKIAKLPPFLFNVFLTMRFGYAIYHTIFQFEHFCFNESVSVYCVTHA